MQPTVPHPQEFYISNFNITDSDGPLVLPPLPHGNTFVVTSSLMQMLTARGLYAELPSEDSHSHIVKRKSLCKSCLGRSYVDMNIIGLRVFPLFFIGDAVIWFTMFPYNSIYTWDQLKDVFLDLYCPVSKNRNHKDRVKNFVELPRESVSNSLDRFTGYMRGIINHHIDNE